MTISLKTVFIAISFFYSVHLFSQSKIENNPLLITNTHYYTFEGNLNTNKEQMNLMQEELKKLEFVVDVVIKFSNEKKSGFIKVITQEKPITSEGDRSFSPAILKNELLKYNLSPERHTVEEGIK